MKKHLAHRGRHDGRGLREGEGRGKARRPVNAQGSVAGQAQGMPVGMRRDCGTCSIAQWKNIGAMPFSASVSTSSQVAALMRLTWNAVQVAGKMRIMMNLQGSA